MTEDFPLNDSYENAAVNDSIISQEIDDAIANLDFETAGRLQESLNYDRSDYVKQQVDNAVMRNQSLIDGYKLDAEKYTIQIELDIDTKLSNLVKDYKKRFLQMKAAQLEEIENLKADWIKSHEKAEEIGNQKVESLLYTSKVLANCKCFDEAKTLRNDVQQNTDKILYQEYGDIDKHYKEHMINMISRHKSMLDGLYSQCLNDIKIIEGQGKVDRSIIRAQELVGIAMSPSKAIQDVACSPTLSIEDKKEVISKLSPRKSPSSPISPKSPRSPKSSRSTTPVGTPRTPK